VKNAEKNRVVSIDKFEKKNNLLLEKLGEELMKWRKGAHP
jgi:hypothetical protein